ncbi:MAG: glycosyltransferase, partial [Pseudomonadota bacterium]
TAPANVTVMTNVPPPITWRIARDALAMAIPLRSSETACGHVTIVGAQRLGLPLAVTRSVGVADYVEDGKTALLVEPGDAEAMAEALRRLAENPDLASRLGEGARAEAAARSDLSSWVAYFQGLVEAGW